MILRLKVRKRIKKLLIINYKKFQKLCKNQIKKIILLIIVLIYMILYIVINNMIFLIVINIMIINQKIQIFILKMLKINFVLNLKKKVNKKMMNIKQYNNNKQMRYKIKIYFKKVNILKLQ